MISALSRKSDEKAVEVLESQMIPITAARALATDKIEEFTRLRAEYILKILRNESNDDQS